MVDSVRSAGHSESKAFEAIVIGGGIAGCTLAYELARRKIRVGILEQSVLAAESSGWGQSECTRHRPLRAG